MNRPQGRNAMNHLRISSLTLSLLALAGCGGGGGDTTTAPPPAPEAVSGYPASGAYGWTLKASGPTNAIRHGLSLAHPAMPENEYVVETASEAITDTRLVFSGSVNAAQRTATNVQPHALVYILGGDVRSVSMQADGSVPRAGVKRSSTTSACRFLLVANDHAQPDRSRFIVSTAGNDGNCGTADDGRAEVRLSSGSTLGYTLLAGEAPLDVARDPVTLAPRGWIYGRQVALWDTPASPIALRAEGTPALTAVVVSTPQAALVSDGTRMSVIDFTGTWPEREVNLDAATTAGTWRLLGFDANHFYVYNDNPGNNLGTPWTVLRISRQNPTAATVASGTGLITVASMGSNMLYLTVFRAGATPQENKNILIRVPKTGGLRFETEYAIDVKPTVQTSASGRHLRWLVSGIGSATVTHRVTFIDEAGVELHDVPGGYPLAPADAATENFNASESRTRFLVAQGFGVRAFSNTSLVSYDAETGTASTLGSLPGTAEYGDAVVFATASGGPSTFGVGFATRSVYSGLDAQNQPTFSYDGQTARVFSYRLGAANSLTTATRR